MHHRFSKRKRKNIRTHVAGVARAVEESSAEHILGHAVLGIIGELAFIFGHYRQVDLSELLADGLALPESTPADGHARRADVIELCWNKGDFASTVEKSFIFFRYIHTYTFSITGAR